MFERDRDTGGSKVPQRLVMAFEMASAVETPLPPPDISSPSSNFANLSCIISNSVQIRGTEATETRKLVKFRPHMAQTNTSHNFLMPVVTGTGQTNGAGEEQLADEASEIDNLELDSLSDSHGHDPFLFLFPSTKPSISKAPNFQTITEECDFQEEKRTREILRMVGSGFYSLILLRMLLQDRIEIFKF
nr:hypothetical protein Iba_chr11fCG11610 [Ipomoea batatas]